MAGPEARPIRRAPAGGAEGERRRAAAVDGPGGPSGVLVRLSALGRGPDRVPDDPPSGGLAPSHLLRQRLPSLRLEGGGCRAAGGGGRKSHMSVDVGAVS